MGVFAAGLPLAVPDPLLALHPILLGTDMLCLCLFSYLSVFTDASVGEFGATSSEFSLSLLIYAQSTVELSEACCRKHPI